MSAAASGTVADRFARVAALVRECRDIIDERVTAPVAPGWARERGWAEFLVSLPQEALRCGEAHGLIEVVEARVDAPPSLVGMLRRVADATALPDLHVAEGTSDAAWRRVKARKRRQLAALLTAAADLSHGAERIVDVGAGQGHLTRAASEAWGKDALGLERQAPLVDVARALAEDRRVAFRQWDAFAEAVPLCATDLVTGLHACGELGDVLIRSAAAAGSRVLLVSCCPQKVRGRRREPLSSWGRRSGLIFDRGVLGLANLSQLEQGVETSLSNTMKSRETRHAMRLLLGSRGLVVEAGAEMRGVNRRQAYRGLPALAERVLRYRGLAPATLDELQDHENRGKEEFWCMRRLSLPRTTLARLIEVAIVLDRAMHLSERGYLVKVAQVFDATVSPRNLGIFGVMHDREPTLPALDA